MNNSTHNGHVLVMNLYIDRISGYNRFTFSRVPDGWYFELVEDRMVTDHDALQFFEYLRQRDQFSYCPSIGSYFEFWWEYIREGTMTMEELQEKVDQLARWLSQCEMSKPKW